MSSTKAANASATAKVKWTKPVVRRLRAGAAELNPGATIDDADPQGHKNNS